MAETMGSLIDKICIMELKVFYMTKQVERTDATEEHLAMCRQRVGVLKTQRDDLARELDGLIEKWSAGTWQPKIYRQYKMYNDPRFRIPQGTNRGS